MNLSELENEIEKTLISLKLKYRKLKFKKTMGYKFVNEDFGVIICVFIPMDFTSMNELLKDNYNENWSIIHITTDDNIIEKRKEIIWEFGKNGYFRWLRFNFPNQFKHMLFYNNLANDIINYRLNCFSDKKKYNYLKKENELVKKIDFNRLLSNDPGFFDYIP